MKQFILALMVLLTAAESAPAQGAQAELVKQKAMQIRDQNNQQQGITPQSAAAPAAPAAVPAPPPQTLPAGMNLAPQPLLNRFDTDLKTVKAGTDATPDQKQALSTDLTAIVKGATKPAKATITKLAGDLSTALAEKALGTTDMPRLARDVNVVLNSALLTAARTQPYVADAQKVFKTAGVSQATVDAIGSDLHAIIVEIQQSKPKLYQ